MTVVFLIGGTGNQLFQFFHSHPNDKFSSFFLSRPVRQILNWTRHENIFSYPKPNIFVHFLALIILFIDILIVKIVKISLFTTFDLRGVKTQAKLYKFSYIGYSQSGKVTRQPKELSDQLNISDTDKLVDVAIHIRGGDLLAIEKLGKNTYGMLTSDYYRRAIAEIKNIKNITIFTDDIEYATQVFNDISTKAPTNIVSIDLNQTISKCINSREFISSNSTLSFWIVQLRGKKKVSIAPLPFWKRGDLDFPSSVIRIDPKY